MDSSQLSTSIVIKTKLTSPQTLIQPMLRERLQSIDGLISGQYQVVSVIAPAGYGKSILLSQWQQVLQQQGIQTAWLSLDFDDNVLTRFLDYLIAALQQISPKLGEKSQKMLQSGVISNFTPLFDALATDLWQLDHDSVLFLDDVQRITSPELLSLLSQLLERLPPTVCFVLAGRSQPELGLHKLRVQQQLLEFGADDVRFTLPETTQFMNDFKHLSLDVQSVEVLCKRTEGWVAALQLSSLVLDKIDDKQSFIDGLSGRDKNITDYLGDVVLAQQTEAVTDFLLKTSVLDRMNAELCEVVTGIPNCQEILEGIESANLFLIPLDRERQWYRYHHLFADFLKYQLEKSKADQMSALYQKASTWCDKQDFKSEAINYAVVGKNYDQAGQLLSKYAVDLLISEGDHATMLHWIGMFPAEFRLKYPFIRLGYAISLSFQNQAEEANIQFNALDCDLLKGHPQANFVRPYIAVFQSILYMFQGRVLQTRQLTQQWLIEWPNADVYLKSVINSASSCAGIFSYDFKDTVALNTAALQSAKQLNLHYSYAWMTAVQGTLLMKRGDAAKARNVFEEAKCYVCERLTEQHYGVLLIDLHFAEVLYEQGDTPESKQRLDRTFYIFEHLCTFLSTLLAYRTLTRLHLNQFELDAAEKLLKDAHDFIASHQWYLHSYVLVYEHIRHHISMNNLMKAQQLARQYGVFDELPDAAKKDEILESCMQKVISLIKAKLLIASGNYNQALIMVDALIVEAKWLDCKRDLITLLIIKSSALYAQSHQEQASELLQEALMLGQPDNYIQIFIEEGQMIQPLIKTLCAPSKNAQKNDLKTDYLQKILDRFAQHDALADQQKNLEEEQPIAMLLTKRELSILALLESELAHQQIADELGITTGTLRWNLRNVYQKLAVRNRSGAIKQAKVLALLNE